MGGNLYSMRRVSRDEYFEILLDVYLKLGRTLAYVPKTFSEKEDFGDLDLCLHEPLVSEDFIKKTFNTDKVSLNTSVLSFQYGGEFQVDLCHFPKEDLDSAVNYMSYGDTSNMIGVIANYSMGLRYTHRGLVAPVKLKQEEPLGEIIISKDVEKIMGFMDLDYSKWDAGFSNELEVFNWITQSKYFNAEHFKFENLNHQNRTRNKKRAMYSRFVDWLENKQTSGYEEKNKANHIWRAMLTFGNDWIDAAKFLITDHRQQQQIRKTFNGYDVREITGLEGKALGDCLTKYQNSVGCDEWKEFVLKRTREEMIEHFKNWYAKR